MRCREKILAFRAFFGEMVELERVRTNFGPLDVMRPCVLDLS